MESENNNDQDNFQPPVSKTYVFDTIDPDLSDNIPTTTTSTSYGKELRCMMYGFGDDMNPYTESVELLEDIVLKYISDTTRKAMEVGKTGKITVEDIMYILRKDPRKLARVKELLLMNEELKKSRKAFDFDMLANRPPPQ